MSEIYNLFAFEIKSLIGRKIFKKRTLIPSYKKPILLDLGVGSNFTDGWIHIDFFVIRNPIKKLFNPTNRRRLPEVQTDLRYPLNCPDNVIEGIYTSHTIEHLRFQESKTLLKETYRILIPGKYIRIVVPDISKVIDFYLGKNNDYDFNTGCEAISAYTQGWGHKSVWDEKYLKIVLKDVGFVNVSKVEYATGGNDKRLIKEEEVRKFESVVIEAQKPF